MLNLFQHRIQINEAIKKEKQLKNGYHDWKINLIKENNPKLKTLE